MGIFATYDEVLVSAGPMGIWLWIIVSLGQTLVGLVVAQFAARIALSGSSYQWASRLANPKVGWLFGWLTFGYLAIASTRLLELITAGAVWVELGIVVVLVIALVVAMAFTGCGTLDNLTSRGVTAGDPNYLAIGGGLMAGMIMGLTTLVGFDSAANLAEEAKDPFRSVPRAIVASVVAAGVFGLALLIVLTVAIKDIPGITREWFAGCGDHPRRVRSGHGKGAAGLHRVCHVRYRDGCDGGVLAAGVRNGA